MRKAAPGLVICVLAAVAACGGGILPAGIDDDGRDAGSADGGTSDAGPDAGAADAGSTDAGSTDAGSTDAGSTDAGSNDAGSPDAGSDAGPVCPDGMAKVPGLAVCIDRWEAALLEELSDGGTRRFSPYYNPGALAVRAESSPNRQPQGYISGTQSASACARAGKRLCTLAEWMAACQGFEKRTYPYGNAYVATACNEGRTPHPVVEFYGTSVGVWDSLHMNDAGINQQHDTVADSGTYSQCATPEGVYDLHGNLHEWIADGSFKGGFYVDAKLNGNGCYYRTTAHAMSYHDYSTGFRCCADRP